MKLCVFVTVVIAAVTDSAWTTNSTALAELSEIQACSTDQLNAAEIVLTTESNTLSCEKLLGIKSGMLLQSAKKADALCEHAVCLNALRKLYRSLPDCRYKLWGLQYSAEKFLNHCGIETNATSSA